MKFIEHFIEMYSNFKEVKEIKQNKVCIISHAWADILTAALSNKLLILISNF